MKLLSNHERAMVDSYLDNQERDTERERELQSIPLEDRPIITRFLKEIARIETKIDRLKNMTVNVAWGHQVEAGDKVLITTVAEYDDSLADELARTVRAFLGEGVEVLFIWGATATVESQSGL